MKRTMFRGYAMRACAVALCGAALCAVPVLAQSGDGAPPVKIVYPGQRIAALDKAVTLTDDQKTKIMALYELNMRKMQNMMAAHNPEMPAKMIEMREDENRQIRAMMTEEQRPKFEVFLVAQRQSGL